MRAPEPLINHIKQTNRDFGRRFMPGLSTSQARRSLIYIPVQTRVIAYGCNIRIARQQQIGKAPAALATPCCALIERGLNPLPSGCGTDMFGES